MQAVDSKWESTRPPRTTFQHRRTAINIAQAVFGDAKPAWPGALFCGNPRKRMLSNGKITSFIMSGFAYITG
jgi:hypothetical protein